MRVWITIAAVAASLSGCASINQHIDTPIPDTVALSTAETHYHSVLDALGPPAQLTSLPDGFAFLYESLIIRERQIGIQLTPGEMPGLFKLNYGRARAERHIHVLRFDEGGMLQAHGVFDGTQKLGNSITLQPIFSVTPTVKTTDLVQPPPQQNWGFSLFDPLPESLNANQSLDSGTAGFEIRGTPSDVGQRSLEFRGKPKKRR
jgi:hypothetical protein